MVEMRWYTPPNVKLPGTVGETLGSTRLQYRIANVCSDNGMHWGPQMVYVSGDGDTERMTLTYQWGPWRDVPVVSGNAP